MVKVIILILMIKIYTPVIIYASEGMTFLKIESDARGNSLSGTVISEVSGVESIYWNPAGLSRMDDNELMVSYSKLVGMDYFYGAIGTSSLFSGSGKGIGCSILYLDKGSLYESINRVNSIDDLRSYDIAINGSVGITTSILNIGGTIKFIKRKIFGEIATATLYDIGGQFLYSKNDNLKIGIVIKNIGSKFKVVNEDENPPKMYQIGMSYKYNNINKNFLILTSVEFMDDSSYRINLGVEYEYIREFYARVGYKKSFKKNGYKRNLSIGVGIRKEKWGKIFKVDIAWIPMLYLGDIIQITSGITF